MTSGRSSLRPVLSALAFAVCAAGCRTVDTAPPSSVAPAAGVPSPASNPALNAKPLLRRGMNLGNALDAPSEGEWGVVLDASDFVSFKQAGFDHVRLPVRFNAHAGAAAPYEVDRAFFARVDWAIAQALANGLAVVVDFHHYMDLMSDPDGHRDRFLAIWKQIAERYKDQPQAVCFELLNEPNDKLTADKWNAILGDALRIVRTTNPTRTVVVEGVFWASAKNLRDTLVVPEGDANLVGSFHMYQPILCTHQGAPWMGPEYQTTGVVYPGPPAAALTPAPAASAVPWVRGWFDRYNHEPAATNPSGLSTVADELDTAQAWATRHRLPVYMGEFGSGDVADAASRARWTKATRTEAERRGFGWAYWDDGGSFKVYERPTRTWVTALKAALLE